MSSNKSDSHWLKIVMASIRSVFISGSEVNLNLVDLYVRTLYIILRINLLFSHHLLSKKVNLFDILDGMTSRRKCVCKYLD